MEDRQWVDLLFYFRGKCLLVLSGRYGLRAARGNNGGTAKCDMGVTDMLPIVTKM